MTTTPRILIIGYGNPGRRDDGLGWLAADQIERAGLPSVRVCTDYQLNIEHAADVAESNVAIFIDAAVQADDRPFFFRRLLPRHTGAFSTHVMRPEAVLALAQQTMQWRGCAYLLGIRGYDFDAFEETLSPGARSNLCAATEFLIHALQSDNLDGSTSDPPTDDSYGPCHGGEPCTKASM